MDEIARLGHLIEHWMEHNEEHAKTYRQWAGKAITLGNGDLGGVLIEIAEETERMQALFKKARELC